jgi:hypothetical protein
MLHGVTTSSSVGSTALVGFGLINCRWAFSAGRFYRVPLPAARQTSNLEENQRFRAFQLSPQEDPIVWSDASEPSSGRWNYGWENGREILPKVTTSTSLLCSFICRKARHGTDGFTSPPKEDVLRIFYMASHTGRNWIISTTTVWTSYLAFFLLSVGRVTHRANLDTAMM